MILKNQTLPVLVALSFAIAAPVAARQPVPSFNDHPEHYSDVKRVGVQGRTAATIADDRGPLPIPSFIDHPEQYLPKSALGVEGRSGASVKMDEEGWPPLPKSAY